MAKRHRPEEIIVKLRQGPAMEVDHSVQAAHVSPQTLPRDLFAVYANDLRLEQFPI